MARPIGNGYAAIAQRKARKNGKVFTVEFPKWKIVSEYWALHCKIECSFGKNTSEKVRRFLLLIAVPNCQQSTASFCPLVKVVCYAPFFYERVSLTIGNRDRHPKTASFHACLDAFSRSVCLLGLESRFLQLESNHRRVLSGKSRIQT